MNIYKIDQTEYRVSGNETISLPDGYKFYFGYMCDSCYAVLAPEDEIVTGECVSAENEQKINNHAVMHKECADKVKSEKFLADTNEFYDWTSPTGKIVDYIRDNDEIEKDDLSIREYLAEAKKLGVLSEAQEIINSALSTRGRELN